VHHWCNATLPLVVALNGIMLLSNHATWLLWCCDKELKIRWPAGAAAVASGPLLSAVGMRLVQHLIPSSCSSCSSCHLPLGCHLAARPVKFPSLADRAENDNEYGHDSGNGNGNGTENGIGTDDGSCCAWWLMALIDAYFDFTHFGQGSFTPTPLEERGFA